MTKNTETYGETSAAKAPAFGIGHRICLLATILTGIFSILIALYCYRLHERECLGNYAASAMSISNTVASLVDGDVLLAELSGADESGQRRRLANFLDKIQRKTRASEVYVVGPPRDGMYPMYGTSGNDKPLGALKSAESFPAEMGQVLETGRSVRSPVYSSSEPHAVTAVHTISTFSPIFDSDGKVVGIAGTDVGVDLALRETTAFGAKLIVACLAMTGLVAAILFFFMRTRLIRPLALLARASRRLAQGETDIPRLPRSRDEIGAMSRNISKVARAIGSLTFGAAAISGSEEDGRMHPAPLTGKFLQLADGIRKALTIMDNVDALVYVVDPQTYELVYYNKKMERIHAITSGSASELHCWQLLGDQPDRPCSVCKIPELSEKLEEFPSCQWEHYNKQLRAWFHITNSLVRWIDGRTVLFCECRDITRQKSIEELQKRQEDELAATAAAAHEASLLKSSFLANMSHEIRTPMNGIIGFAELAMDDPGISPQNRNHLGQIRTSAEGLLRVINDILDLSKIEGGEMELERVPFTIQEIMDQCESACGRLAREKGLQLFCYAEPFIKGTMMGDPRKLLRVLVNLLSNAVKFTEKGVVKLACTVEQATARGITLRFEVSDSGIGMSPEQLSRIFDAFIQGDSSTTRKYGGAGLGLAITKHFIELMGGQLQVVSTPAIGSKFSFHLAFEALDSIESSKPASPARTESRMWERPYFRGDVLVCEGQKGGEEILREHLEWLGLSVTMAENGKLGVEEVRKRRDMHRPYAVIFIDLGARDAGGKEAAAQIRQEGCLTPIIGLGADVRAVDATGRTGVSDMLAKPFRAVELWECLRRHLTETPVSATEMKRRGEEAKRPGTPAGVAVDLAEGLENAAGNEVILQRLLSDFLRANRTKVEEISAALAAGEKGLAYRLACGLKGESRMIGAVALADAAGMLSGLLRDGMSAHLPPEALEQVDRELARVLEELSALERHKPVAAETAGLDIRKMSAALDRLEPVLRRGDSASIDTLEEVRHDLEEPNGKADELAKRIEESDFDAALSLLTEIRDWLDVRDGLEAENE